MAQLKRQQRQVAQQVSSPTHIKDLVADPANRRAHNPRNIGMLVDALQKVGLSRSIVVDEDGVILAGNGVVEAASEAGLTRLQIVEADGETLVAVRRRGLTAEQKRDLAIYDNRTAELATWNTQQFKDDLAGGKDFAAFFTPAELAAILGQAEPDVGLTDPDAVPQERPTGIVAGDLFELGGHRLLCGDATAQADVARLLGNVAPTLMVTDPPYGVDYDPDWRNQAKRAGSMKQYGASSVGVVTNDDRADWREAWALFPGDVCYIWHGALHALVVADSLAASKFEIRAQIIWAKQHAPISRGHYHWQHEPCWYAVRKGATGHWAGDRKQTTLWTIANANAFGGEAKEEATGHGTQKPVECMRRPIENNSVTGAWVYEPFLGSGTTVVAGEQIGRPVLAIEINPTYVQQAIDRWEAFTGQTAQKVGEAVRA